MKQFTHAAPAPKSSRRLHLLPITLPLLLGLLVAGCAKVTSETRPPEPLSDFTFIHASDVHAPMPASRTTIARIRELGEIDLAPFNLRVPKPGFVLVTGDLTEFGGGNGWWEEYLSYWKDCGMPVYHQLGNHDNTWHACLKGIRELGQNAAYSFDRHGAHFVGLMTATLQDPRPSVGEEIILWLKEDLKKVGPKTPVFVFLHHPLGGSEFASRYDYDRLLDVLREYNTVLLMAGHSHGYVHRPIHGLDQMTGGSTFGPNSGLAVVSVKDRTLRAAYWKNDQPAPHHKLIEKPIPSEASHPKIEISAPAFRNVTGSTLTLTAQLTGAVEVDKATWTINDDLKGDLALTGGGSKWQATGSAQIGGLLPGAHYLRVEFSKGDQRHIRSTQFFFEPTSRPTAWRAYLAGSSKVTPTIADGVVYVGANDGHLRAFQAETGKDLWSVNTGAEILAQPLVDGDRVYSANGLGEVSAFTKAGKKLWTFTAGDAVYSSPVLAEGKVIFGCNDGKLYAVDASAGKQAWVNSDATYAIESKPFVANGRVYFGAWDQQIRCVDARDGKLIWKRICEGARVAKAAHRYYSAGDAMPVVAEGKLHIADRGYHLTILDADTGEPIATAEKVSATGLSEDGRFVYRRMTDGRLAKTDSSGKELWSVPAEMNFIPTAPTEKNGVVYVASAKGMVSALAADDGKLLWRYQASPQLFVMSSVVSDGERVYATAFDGTLTAIKCP